MNYPRALAHTVVIGHSRKWSRQRATEYRARLTSLVTDLQIRLRRRFDSLDLRAEFLPYDPPISPEELLHTLSDASLAILDITDADDELVFLAGSLVATGVRTLLLAHAESAEDSRHWLFCSDVIRYESTDDLEALVENACAELGRVVETTPVPRKLIHSLWFPREVPSIWIVCPQIEDPGEYARRSSPDYTYLDNLGDTDSLLEIMVFLSKYYPEATIEKFSSRDLPIGLTKGNLVILGGPGSAQSISNELARSMMSTIRSRVTYSDDCESILVRTLDGDEIAFRAQLTEDANDTDANDRFNLVKDYGYFGRFKNPANESNGVVCINGIHTSGVLGAARAFGDSREALRNYRTVILKMGELPSFECYFEVNVLNGDVRVPHIRGPLIYRSESDVDTEHQPSAGVPEPEDKARHLLAKITEDVAGEEAQMLHAQSGRLRVVHVLARQIEKTHGRPFEQTSGIFLLHALEDLRPFLEAFESLGLVPSCSLFFYKRYPYFHKELTLAWLRDRGYRVAPLEELKRALPEFLQAVEITRRIFVLEDGGYIGPFLHDMGDTCWNQIVGAVEQTERGVRMYEQIGEIRIPVAPVARCGLKNRQEPPHVGRTILANTQRLLQGRNLSGMRCLVLGYGRIGQAVSEAARTYGMSVSVFDVDPGALAMAAQASFNTGADLRALLSDAQLVIGTTGQKSLGREHILALQHGTTLVSGSSGQYEIGIDALEVLSREKQRREYGTEYTLEKEGRQVLLLGDGYPINFFGVDSVPDEAIDPVLAALFVTTVAMVGDPPPAGGIHLDWTNQVIERFELEQLYYDLYFAR